MGRQALAILLKSTTHFRCLEKQEQFHYFTWQGGGGSRDGLLMPLLSVRICKNQETFEVPSRQSFSPEVFWRGRAADFKQVIVYFLFWYFLFCNKVMLSDFVLVVHNWFVFAEKKLKFSPFVQAALPQVIIDER